MTAHDAPAFQDRMHDNFCWGCGPDNPDGLQLKSRWDVADPTRSVAEWEPRPEHAAGPRDILNGGIIATLLDCHGVGTAIASMTVEYLRPAPLEAVLELRGRVVDVDGRFTTVECELLAAEEPQARATVRAVRVPDTWRLGPSGGG
jgi:acyl-coenzyme A thioesterase PaaI-like protein